MANVFFQATKDALDNITAAFDFVHPLRASMQYTRRRVTELSVNNTNADDLFYQAEIDPSASIHGVPYKEAFINTPWEKQEERLSWLLLNNLFAIFEGWAQRIFEERFVVKGSYGEKVFIKGFQFPGLSTKFSTYYARGTNKSDIMANAFFDVYQTTSQLDFSKLENYLLLYRYYKEARNCYMHRNFVASQDVIDAYNAYLPVASLSALDAEEVPIIIPPILGQPVRLSLRGVIGFSQFVRRILIIADINLIKTTAAEDEFLSKKPHDWHRHTLSGDTTRAKGQITKYANKAGVLKPRWSEEYQQFLISKGLFGR